MGASTSALAASIRPCTTIDEYLKVVHLVQAHPCCVYNDGLENVDVDYLIALLRRLVPSTITMDNESLRVLIGNAPFLAPKHTAIPGGPEARADIARSAFCPQLYPSCRTCFMGCQAPLHRYIPEHGSANCLATTAGVVPCAVYKLRCSDCKISYHYSHVDVEAHRSGAGLGRAAAPTPSTAGAPPPPPQQSSSPSSSLSSSSSSASSSSLSSSSSTVSPEPPTATRSFVCPEALQQPYLLLWGGSGGGGMVAVGVDVILQHRSACKFGHLTFAAGAASYREQHSSGSMDKNVLAHYFYSFHFLKYLHALHVLEGLGVSSLFCRSMRRAGGAEELILHYLPAIRAGFSRHWGLHYAQRVGTMVAFYNTGNGIAAVGACEASNNRMLASKVRESPGATMRDDCYVDGAHELAKRVIPAPAVGAVPSAGTGCGHASCSRALAEDGHMKNSRSACPQPGVMHRPSEEVPALYLPCSNRPAYIGGRKMVTCASCAFAYQASEVSSGGSGSGSSGSGGSGCCEGSGGSRSGSSGSSPGIGEDYKTLVGSRFTTQMRTARAKRSAQGR